MLSRLLTLVIPSNADHSSSSAAEMHSARLLFEWPWDFTESFSSVNSETGTISSPPLMVPECLRTKPSWSISNWLEVSLVSTTLFIDL
uniref:Uncharacterized protein n=1 Tax=Rhizophora mucronata TaxID=61149 RepID=A0A2P2J7M5_RHIMU